MTIPYRIAKFKSANILAIAILGSTAKFNSRQYFRLYGIMYIADPEHACTITITMSCKRAWLRSQAMHDHFFAMKCSIRLVLLLFDRLFFDHKPAICIMDAVDSTMKHRPIADYPRS